MKNSTRIILAALAFALLVGAVFCVLTHRRDIVLRDGSVYDSNTNAPLTKHNGWWRCLN